MAETAAIINRERNKNILSVTSGILLRHGSDQRINIEINVALESAQIANSIFPGTVEKFVVTTIKFAPSGIDIHESRITTAYWINRIREKAHSIGLNVKIGILKLHGTLASTEDRTEWKNVVLAADFVICVALPQDEFAKMGVKYAFSKIRAELLQCKSELKKISSKIEIMGATLFPSAGSGDWYNSESLGIFWNQVNKFANEETYLTFLPAFDFPRLRDAMPNLADVGWWKLIDDNLMRNASGYIEKVSESFRKPLTTSSSRRYYKYVAMACGIAWILLCIVAYVLWTYKNRQQMDHILLPKHDIHEFFHGRSQGFSRPNDLGLLSASALAEPYNTELEIPTENLIILIQGLNDLLVKDIVLGTGQYGCVYKGFIKNSTNLEIAVKTTKNDSPPTALKGLLSEIKILTYLGRHSHIVSIYGVHTAELKSGIVYLATEFCAMGCLRNQLTKFQRDKRENEYVNDFKCKTIHSHLVRWMHEIACGMEYLEMKRVIHADLATRNILLSSDWTAKITDFGLSRRLHNYEKYSKETKEGVPWRWMAFESLKWLEFSTKSDVWSYGITLWEIFSLGDEPFALQSWDEDFIDKLENGLRLKSPVHATTEISEMTKSCWNLRPEDRPTFKELKTITEDLNDNENFVCLI